MADGLPRYRVNGAGTAHVSAADRGLQYGDGLFETIAVRDGRPLRLDRHAARLAAGCVRLGIPWPAGIVDEVREFCAGVPRAVLKLIVTRSGGARGYRPPQAPDVTRVLALHAWPEVPDAWREQGVAVRWCGTRLAVQPALAGLKHLNRLEQVLARAEWHDMDAWQEGLMCDTSGAVIEATQANLFVVHGGRLRTPALDGSGVAGIVRALVVEAAAGLGIRCDEAVLTRAEVDGADEAFLCNTVIGIWPVRRVDAVRLTAPGTVTARVQRWLAERGDD